MNAECKLYLRVNVCVWGGGTGMGGAADGKVNAAEMFMCVNVGCN